MAEKIFPDFRYGWLPTEFQTRLPLELNFVEEAKNCEKCAEIFKDNKNIAVPKVYNDFTTSRVLTMSFEEGIPATNVREMHALGIDLKQCLDQTISVNAVGKSDKSQISIRFRGYHGMYSRQPGYM